LLTCIFFDTDRSTIDGLKPFPLVFWRSIAGREPVREWLNELPRDDQRTIGRDIAKVQFGWPIGLPLCRPLGGGLWEVRSSLPSKREGRVLFGFHDGVLIALHAFIKKTRAAPDEDLALARQRLKEAIS
jgi:phage-related protein